MTWHTIQTRTFLIQNDANQVTRWLSSNLDSNDYEVVTLERIRSTPELPYDFWLMKVSFSSAQYIQMDEANNVFYYEPWNTPEEQA